MYDYQHAENGFYTSRGVKVGEPLKIAGYDVVNIPSPDKLRTKVYYGVDRLREFAENLAQLHETKKQLQDFLKGQNMSKAIQQTIEKTKESDEAKQSSRTLKQNSSLHLWFEQIAEVLRADGLTVNSVVEAMEAYGVEMYPTKETVKEMLFRPIMRKMFGYQSTKQLKDVGDIEKMEDVINKFLSEKVGVKRVPPFPSEETMEAEMMGEL